MDEELIEELNETLRSIWKAGRKLPGVVELRDFRKAMELAVSEGWNAESGDEIDHTYAVMGVI